MASGRKRNRKKQNRFTLFISIIIVIAAVIAALCICVEKSARSAQEEVQTETETESTAAAADEQEDEIVIVLDAGHGFGDVGNDQGFLSNYESYYTLLYVNELKEKLEELGAVVYLTHDGETYPDEDYLTQTVAQYGLTFSSEDVAATAGDNLYNKYERVMYAEILNYEYGVDFFLSLHFNSYETGEVCGAAVFYYEDCPNVAVAETFAELVMNDLGYPSNYSGIYCWDYEEAFAVTKYGSFPSALIECAFMTNADDAANIESSTWRDYLTTLLAESIMQALAEETE